MYNWEQLHKILKEQKYKYVAVKNPAGKFSVGYNKANENASDNLRNAETLSKHWPDGVYRIQMRQKFGANIAPDEFELQIGTVSPALSQPTPTVVVKEKASDAVLSYKEVLALQKELSDAQNSLNFYKSSYEQLEKDYNELEAEHKTLQEQQQTLQQGTDPNSPGAWIENILTNGVPIFDKWTQLEEKKLNAAIWSKNMDAQMKMQQPQMYPQFMPQPQMQPAQQFVPPQPGTEEWNAYIDHLDTLSDEDINGHLQWLSQAAGEQYTQLVINELYEPETPNPANNDTTT